MSQTKAQLISDLVQALNFTGISSPPTNGVYLNSTNKIGLSTASANRLVIDPNGCVLIGGATSSLTVGSVSGGLQLHSTVSTNGAQFSIARFNNDTAGGRLVLGKSRHATTAGGTIVQAGDFAGIIEFAVDDGQDLASRIAEIRAVVETGVAADDTPGYLSFRTTGDNASSTSERLRINKAGNAIFYNFTDNIGSSSSGEGFEFRRGEALRLQRDNGSALIVNRVSASGDIITLRDNATSIGSLGYDDTYTYLNTDASKPLALKVAASTKLVINTNGEVLIGSTVDRGSQKLQVTGQITNGPSDNWSTTSSYYDIAAYGGLTTQGSYEITLTAGGYRNGSGWVDYTVNSVSGYGAQIALNPVTGKIGFRTESGMSTGDTHTIDERMMIAANGQVGVNLTPDASGGLFQIRNNMVYTSGTTDLLTSASKAVLRLRTSSDSSKSLYFGGIDDAATPYLQAGNMSAASSGATASYALVLNPYGGNVGIGTTSPSIEAVSSQTVGGLEIHKNGNDTVGCLKLAGNNNSGGSPGQKTYTQLEHRGGNLTFNINHNGTERFKIDGSGHVHVSDGNLVLASGHGIDFSATSGTGTSELLDDYEEGTFTVAVTTHGNAPTLSGTTSWTGLYTKVGNLVHVAAYIFSLNVDNAGTSNLKITGLPFVANNYTTIAITHDTLTSSDVTNGFTTTGTTYLNACAANGTSGSPLATGNSRFLMFAGSYRVN